MEDITTLTDARVRIMALEAEVTRLKAENDLSAELLEEAQRQIMDLTGQLGDV
jgi:hypothetical protein